MKPLLIATFCCLSLQTFSQTCYTLGPRNNGNGQSASCGSPNCSGNAKTGHFDVVFSSLPSPLPTMQLISVSTPPMPSPFCFDPGSLQSGTTVRYCFRGTNLPSSGTMVIRFTQGATSWSCSYNTDGSGGTILPVRLIGFDARMQSGLGSVLLKWSTASEEDNDRFIIERSDESQQFQAIGTVSGVGNSTTTQHYSYTDQAPLKGISFYRLRQVDADAKFSYSQVKRVDNRITGLHIDRIFPNPTEGDKLTLQLSADEQTSLEASIYNMAGQRLVFLKKRITTGAQNWPIILPALSRGVYQLIIKNQKGEQLTEKVLIN